MKVFGAITRFTFQEINQLLSYLITSPWIGLGVVTLTFSMMIYWVAIADMDVSYVLPIHAASYVLNGLMAWLILREHISLTRWLATFIIALGVFMVGWSQYHTQHRPPPPQSPNASMLITLPFLGIIPKIWLGAFMLALTDAIGDILTAKGIRMIGSFPEFTFEEMLKWLKKVIANPFIVAGISFQALSFLIFLSLLSWADISFVRPATAIGYVISLLGAKLILHERITQGRLIGITVIGLGIAVISLTQ